MPIMGSPRAGAPSPPGLDRPQRPAPISVGSGAGAGGHREQRLIGPAVTPLGLKPSSASAD